jgi:hypothetical protein
MEKHRKNVEIKVNSSFDALEVCYKHPQTTTGQHGDYLGTGEGVG